MEHRKRYGLFEYVSSSKLKLQGFVGLIAVVLLVWVSLLVLESAGAFADPSPFGKITGFWTGVYAGFAFGPPVFFALTSRFWGKVVIAYTLLRAAFGVWIYMTGQSLSLLQYIDQNTWLLFLLFIDGAFFLIAMFISRDRAMRNLSADQDPNARAAYADLLLQPIAFSRWLVGSRLADKVQGQVTRRFVTVLMFTSILLFALISLLGFYDPLLTVDGLPQDAPLSEKLTALFGEWAWPAISIGLLVPAIIMLFFQMSLRPLMALEHETLDERQIQMIRFGHADGRAVSLAMLAIITVLAILKTPSEIIASFSIAALFLAWLTPYFIMAWKLPDGDGSYEEDEDVLEIDYA